MLPWSVRTICAVAAFLAAFLFASDEWSTGVRAAGGRAPSVGAMPASPAFAAPTLMTNNLVPIHDDAQASPSSLVGRWATQASPLQVWVATEAFRQAEILNHAGLVVRDAEGRVTYAWVPFAEDEINGIELLQRSAIPVVTVGFGALGEGVCSIGGQGCGVAECRRTVCQASAADAPYWQYFQQDPRDPSLWQWQVLGASASKVHDGDVFGWSWTAKNPALPALSAPGIAALAGAGDGEGSQPTVRTLLPEGVAAVAPAPAPELRSVAAAAAILVVIGGTGMALARWRRAEAAAA